MIVVVQKSVVDLEDSVANAVGIRQKQHAEIATLASAAADTLTASEARCQNRVNKRSAAMLDSEGDSTSIDGQHESQKYQSRHS